MGDFLSLRVSAVFEDVWYLDSGLFIISAVDEEPRPRRTPGESWGPVGYLASLFPLMFSTEPLSLLESVAYQQAMDATTQHGLARLVSFLQKHDENKMLH